MIFFMETKKRELFVVAGAIIRDKNVFAARRGAKGKTAFKWDIGQLRLMILILF